MAGAIAGRLTVNQRHNVETLVVLQPIAVDTGSPDREGMLVLANGMLVAVLVQLMAPEHRNPGYWFLESGFGSLRDLKPPAFETLEEAKRWLRQRLNTRDAV
ncbi:hypothetical protein [Methylobacterium haplocladii]|uniref:hypothetical protein n=1 Tax=Methylobacterium haplocladii TaxID=1176176 RepID=UPI001EE0CAC2|nr:hypothetical protein [Methylobacterium haplocladii]GJD83427.1 hypothetical protein HPGCJGGD_1294 [Methylobacterium haplocladii]